MICFSIHLCNHFPEGSQQFQCFVWLEFGKQPDRVGIGISTFQISPHTHFGRSVERGKLHCLPPRGSSKCSCGGLPNVAFPRRGKATLDMSNVACFVVV